VCGILGSSLIVIIGIKVLMSKPSVMSHIKKDEEANADDSVLSPVNYEIEEDRPKSDYSGESEEQKSKMRDA